MHLIGINIKIVFQVSSIDILIVITAIIYNPYGKLQTVFSSKDAVSIRLFLVCGRE